MQFLQQSQRRSSEAGKRNFRSKRFSRNLERDPAIRRSHSLHNERDSAGRGAGGGDDDVDDWLDVQSGTFRMDKVNTMADKETTFGHLPSGQAGVPNLECC